LREEAFDANRRILEAGLVVLTFGNVSVADLSAAVMAIKPSGMPYEELSPESMVIVDLETGRSQGSLKPSSDAPTHLVLYRNFVNVGGIVHTHSPYATSWAQACSPIPCLGTTHADHFHGPVPVTRTHTPEEIQREYERETGNLIVETFEAQGLDPLAIPAALVASHGPFVWGRTARDAVENAIALEIIAGLACHSLALAPTATAIAIDLSEKHYRRKHGATAYYGQGKE
jgi:L-ribulose-5-phosphate 4-epimerase